MRSRSLVQAVRLIRFIEQLPRVSTNDNTIITLCTRKRGGGGEGGKETEEQRGEINFPERVGD